MNVLQMSARKCKKDGHKNSLSDNGVAVLDVCFLRIFSGSKGNSMFYNLAISKYLCKSSLL